MNSRVLNPPSDTKTSKDTWSDALRVSMASVSFLFSLRVSHMKKRKKKEEEEEIKQERVLYIEATFVKPRILRRFGNCVSS